MVRNSALLLDLDGTLVDTSTANFEAYRQAGAAHGLVVERGDFERRAQGRNWRQFLPAMLAAAGVDADPAEIAQRKRDIYAGMVGELRLNAALVRLVEGCRTAMRTGLVTTASRESVDAIVDRHALRRLFDVIVTGDDVGRHKPDPEAYLLAAARLDAPVERCVAMEDSDIGAASAEAAGIAVLRVRF